MDSIAVDTPWLITRADCCVQHGMGGKFAKYASDLLKRSLSVYGGAAADGSITAGKHERSAGQTQMKHD